MPNEKAVFMITNKVNSKRFVGISNNIDNEWFNVKRNIKSGLGIRKMKDDFRMYGEESFEFEIMIVSDNDTVLHRLESELAYEYKMWAHGYNTEGLLNYRGMSDDSLAILKLKLYKFIENVDDGKYMFNDLLAILKLCKNDLEILLREMTEDEMRYFKKQVILRNKSAGIGNYYIEVKSF
jgi:hypothetical protein